MEDKEFRELVIRQLSRIDGQLLATQAAVRALSRCHPIPGDAVIAVRKEVELVTASISSKSVPEPFLEGLLDATSCMLPTTPSH